MRKRVLFVPLTVLVICLACVSPAHAQASRTWVSGVGDDANPCSRTAPCKTFAGAISKTAVLGEINCLDPGGFGAVTITKSITIDCTNVFASILNAGTNGIVINIDSMTDTRKTVRLRGLNFNGFDTGLNGVRIIGANTATSTIFIENCRIDGNFGGSARGISDERTGGGELFVSDTGVRDTGGIGIAVTDTTGVNNVTLDNVRVQNSNFGVAVGNNVKMMINRSVFTGNNLAGIDAESGGQLTINNSVSTNNGTGITNNSGTIRFANSDISFNTTGISGATVSFGNNRLLGNTSAGTAPTAAGAVSNTFGQQ